MGEPGPKRDLTNALCPPSTCGHLLGAPNDALKPKAWGGALLPLPPDLQTYEDVQDRVRGNFQFSFSVLQRVSSRFHGCLGKPETKGAQTLGLEINP